MRTANFVTPIQWIMPVVVALAFILLVSVIKEPARKKFMAILIAGAGSVYWSGGFGLWEMAFGALMLIVAYNGLRSYSFIGIGWLLHTAWDLMHHLYGNPLLPFDLTSSLGCAICDPVIAIWCFLGAPALWAIPRGNRVRRPSTATGD
jgi:hypothetical protein